MLKLYFVIITILNGSFVTEAAIFFVMGSNSDGLVYLSNK